MEGKTELLVVALLYMLSCCVGQGKLNTIISSFTAYIVTCNFVWLGTSTVLAFACIWLKISVAYSET